MAWSRLAASDTHSSPFIALTLTTNHESIINSEWELDRANRMVVDHMLAHEERCEEAMLDKMLRMEQRIVSTQADAAAQVVAAADILELQAAEAKHAFDRQAAVESELQAAGAFGGGGAFSSAVARQQCDVLHVDANAHASELVLRQHREMVQAGASGKKLRSAHERQQQQQQQQQQQKQRQRRDDSGFEPIKGNLLLQWSHYDPRRCQGIVNSLEAYDSSYDISAAGVGNGGRRGSCGPESSASAGLEKYGQAVEAR